MPKIALIGAGSMVFCRNLLSDILAFDSLKDVRLSLMDIDAERLELAGVMARSINASRRANAVVETTTDRRRAIAGADYVISTIGVGGFAATEIDLRLPAKYGVGQVIGDTLSIGGIFRSVRSLPVLLAMVKEIEELAPEALLINYTNPMAMHVLAVARTSPVRVVGLCHGVRYTRGRMIALARLAEMNEPARQAILADHRPDEPWQSGFGRFYHECVLDESVETFSAGINHMAAFLVFRQGDKDLYPALHKAYGIEELRRIDAVRLELMHQFGYFMTETSGHISEYLPWFLKDPAEVQRMGLRPLAYIGTCQDLDRALAQYRQCAKDGREFIAPDEPVSIEYCSRILNAIQTGQPYVFNGNVHNAPGQLITNLPADSCVEVPIVADRGSLRPTRVGELPPQIAAMIRTNINVQDLTVRAVVERRCEFLYHAAMLDPNAASTLTLPRIRQLVDEMIAAHGDLIPAYLR